MIFRSSHFWATSRPASFALAALLGLSLQACTTLTAAKKPVAATEVGAANPPEAAGREKAADRSAPTRSTAATGPKRANALPRTKADREQETDLRATVASALEHSASIRRAQADLSNAGVDVKIAYAGYQPQLRSSAGLGTDDEWDYGLTLAQPLYDWGRTRADVNRTKAQLLSAQANLRDAAEGAALAAVQAHIAVRLNETLAEAARENLEVHQRFTQLAKDRTSGGVGDASEVELAAVNQGEAESALEDARGALRKAVSVYYSRVGQAPRRLAPVPELPLFLGRDNNVETAALEAPAVIAARARQDAARNQARVERADLLPKLSAEAFVRGDGEDEVYTGVGLRIVGPTLLGLSNFNRVEAANLRVESAKWAAEAARRDATLAVQELFDQEPTLRGRISILDAQLVRARALRELYEDQFKIGERKLSDLVSVQADIFRIEQSLIRARYDILDLQYNAAAALGNLVKALEITPNGDRK